MYVCASLGVCLCVVFLCVSVCVYVRICLSIFASVYILRPISLEEPIKQVLDIERVCSGSWVVRRKPVLLQSCIQIIVTCKSMKLSKNKIIKDYFNY